VSRYQKGKTSLDYTGARDSEWQWHQLGHMQVCNYCFFIVVNKISNFKRAIFGLRMHKKRLVTQTRTGSLQRSPDPLAGFKGAASRWGRDKREEGKRNRPPATNFWICHCTDCMQRRYSVSRISSASNCLHIFNGVVFAHALNEFIQKSSANRKRYHFYAKHLQLLFFSDCIAAF